MQLAKNVIVAERFKLNRLLGRGGMGSVWHATHLGLDIPCAVKFIEGGHANVAEAAARFEREAKAAAQIRSPNVVQILDHGIFEGTPYIAMELLEGEDLGKRLHRVKRLPPSEVVAIVRDVARALRKAHGFGIVHRDLKPDNIFLVHDDEDREVAKVLDFGIAKMQTTELSAKTRTGELLGTPHYMSPEQAQGNRAIDWRSDLWSLAIITFECLTGARPFDSDALGDLLLKIFTAPLPVPSAIADLPVSFDAWWLRAVARDPAARFQTAKAFAESLAMALAVDRPQTDTGPRRAARASDPDLAGGGAMGTNPTPVIAAIRADGSIDSVSPMDATHRLPGTGDPPSHIATLPSGETALAAVMARVAIADDAPPAVHASSSEAYGPKTTPSPGFGRAREAPPRDVVVTVEAPAAGPGPVVAAADPDSVDSGALEHKSAGGTHDGASMTASGGAAPRPGWKRAATIAMLVAAGGLGLRFGVFAPRPKDGGSAPASSGSLSSAAFDVEKAAADVTIANARDVDAKAVLAVMPRAKLLDCYKAWLRTTRDRADMTATLYLSIDRRGHVDGVGVEEGRTMQAGVAQCVEEVVSALSLRRDAVNEAGATADVSLTFRTN